MTHADIFTKFMIEYDKANITSSYPSLTDYEIATILDKAYLALIAQKLTGNNFRKSTLEGDTKAIEDIQNLITRSSVGNCSGVQMLSLNELVYNYPTGLLYFISGTVQQSSIQYPLQLISHTIANKYKVSSINYPWIETPVCYMENNKIHVLVNPDDYTKLKNGSCMIEYIKTPLKFIDDYSTKHFSFELNDEMAEELINLAIIMSLEIVESSKLDNKIKTSALES